MLRKMVARIASSIVVGAVVILPISAHAEAQPVKSHVVAVSPMAEPPCKTKKCVQTKYKKYKYSKLIKVKLARRSASATAADLKSVEGPENVAVSCYIATGTAKAMSIANIRLFTIYLSAKYCHRGGSPISVRYVASDYSIDAPLLWRGGGLKSRNSAIDWSVDAGKSYVKYEFIEGAYGIDIAHPTPCVRLVMKGSSASMDFKCSAYA